ncbi:MAG: ABC transporter permease, partial [Pseudolabrys sp.]|nr:ABC transporter permease [Pseudolabrys sp.]
MNRQRVFIRLAPWLFTIGLFVLWEGAVRLFNIPVFFLPPPSAVAEAFVQFWGPLARNSWITLETTLIGFALAVVFGMALGLLIGWSRTIYAGLYPLMIGFNAIPKV